MTRNELSRFLNGVPSADDLWDEQDAQEDTDPAQSLDRNWREAAEQLTGSSAQLSRWLSLRLRGTDRPDGALDSRVTTELLGALNKEVREAAPEAAENALALELVGMSAGSTILHFEPANNIESQTSDQIASEVDPLDDAISTIFDLHEVVHSRGDVRRFASNPGLLRGFKDLTTALEKNELELDMEWRSATGRNRHVQINRSDVTYAQTLWSESSETHQRLITGIVTVLNLGGMFTLKLSVARTAKKYDIHMPEGRDLISLGLTLGETVTVNVKEINTVNSLGVELALRYEFLDQVFGEQELPSDVEQ